jgi:hypothetical protein
LAALLLTGGCTVPSTSSPDDVGQQTLQRFFEDRVVHWDLTAPRTAQELGVRKGSYSAIFDRNGDDYWTVTFDLPGGRQFTSTRAIAVGVFIPDVPGGLLDGVTVNAHVRDLDELTAELASAATQLGLNREHLAGFLGQQRRFPLSTRNPESSTVLSGPAIGHLTTDVEPRLGVNDDGIAINYTFNWTPAAAAPVARP